MNTGDFLRCILLFLGVYLLGLTVFSLAKRKMTEPVCLAWGGCSLLMILGGLFLQPDGINSYISNTGLFLLLLAFLIILSVFYFLSCQISDLIRKNQKLTMEIALLMEEQEKLEEEVKALQERLPL